MQYPLILRILGLLLMLFSLCQLAPIPVGFYYGDKTFYPFFFSFVMTFLTGFLFWWRFRATTQSIKTRDGFLVVGLFWGALSLFGAIPLFIALNLSPDQPLTFIDALFESTSGLTTTGGSIFRHLDPLPHAIQFYRHELQFLGGMSIVVLAVAILPILDISGVQLYHAETLYSVKDGKLTPRITETAKSLWFIYTGLTFACILSFWFAGMGLFDAVNYAFSTISTGGFSSHDASFEHFHSGSIELIAVLFMLLGAMNFGLHFLAFKNASLFSYWQDAELRFYLILIGSLTAVVMIVLLSEAETHFSWKEMLIDPLFTVVSILTTTGFTLDTPYWPVPLSTLLLFVSLVGGCRGSTTGGIKVLRIQLLGKQTLRELHRLIHPKAIYTIKLGKLTLSDRNIENLLGIALAYVALTGMLTFLALMSGLDLSQAFSVIISCVGNTGVLIGSVQQSYADLSPFVKGLGIFGMIAGRLEIFSLMVLFLPTFWRS